MSPYLVEQLFEQITRVIAKPLAITDRHGKILARSKTVAEKKSFTLPLAPANDGMPLPVEGQPTYRAIPIRFEDRLYVMVVTEINDEDTQTAQIITSLAELIIQQFILTHRPKPDAVDLLLTRVVYRPQTIDPEELEQQMAALGYRLDVQRAAVVVQLRGFWDNYLQTVGQPLSEKGSLIAAKKHDLEQSLTSFFSKNQDNIIGYIGNDAFLILKDLSSTDYERFCQLLKNHFAEITNPLKNIHITDVRVGIGSVAHTPASLLLSAREAVQIMALGEKISPAETVYRVSSLGVLPLVIDGSREQKLEYAVSLLDRLDGDSELETTLQAFLDHNLNLTDTAEALKIHRNTVIYRLDKITERLGKDPRDFRSAVELFIAHFFRKVLS